MDLLLATIGMAQPILTSEPTAIAAGDSLSFTKSLADYPVADGWGLLYCFRGKDLVALDVASTTSNGLHIVTLAAAETSLLTPGKYTLVGYAKNGSERVTIFNGFVVVTPNIESAVDGQDTRTQARRTLDNINAVLESRASSSILSSTVDGTSLGRIPHSELLKLRDYYQRLVDAEEAAVNQALGKPSRKNIYARFGLP